jgi:signal peptidase I
MTELNLNPEQASSSPQAMLQHKPSSRWKKATVAGFLSLLIAGMGQLYDRRPRKAFWLALTIPILLVLAAQTRIVFSFFTMVAFFTILVAWRLFIAAEAAYNAWIAKKAEAAVSRPRLTYPLVAVVLLVAALYPSYDDLKRWTSFAAFKVPSASMCPTICSGERIVADLGAYRSKSPGRGDLILLQHRSSPALFIKRVVGLPGDIVGPGPDGTILVNGKTLIFPEVCGTPVQQKYETADYSMFNSRRVPEGTFFVVGDSLGNSFDSRIPEFGPVVLGDVRGKPIFLYWSPSRSRIGCTIR